MSKKCKCQDSSGAICGAKMNKFEKRQDGMCSVCADHVWYELTAHKDYYWTHGSGEMTKKKYLLITCTITPYMCTPITYSVAISEALVSFIRHNHEEDEFQTFHIDNIYEISLAEYYQLMLLNESGWYVTIQAQDIVEEEK